MALANTLRQSTAANVLVGPMVDSGNGSSVVSVLSIGQANVQLSKNAAAFTQKNDSSSATARGMGYFSVALNTTDTNTQGVVTLMVSGVAGVLPVRHDYEVVGVNVYDTLFANSKFSVDVDRITGSAFSAIGLIDSGIAQATTTNTITLRSGFQANSAVMPGATVFITDAINGMKDRSIILSYNSGTQVATVDAWAIQPVGVVSYEVFATPRGSTTNPSPANVIQIYSDEHAAKRMRLGALAMISGAAIAGTLSTTQMTTDLLEATSGHFEDRALVWTSGNLTGLAVVITAYNGSTKLVTYTTIPTGESPQAGDQFLIV